MKAQAYVFVCFNRRQEGHPLGSCFDRGSQDTWQRLRELQDAHDIDVRICYSGCLGPCEYGPVVAIMPDDVFYGTVDAEMADHIVESHLLNGEVVADLLIPPEAFEH
jgi:(2Fe-2S) ferredoxin